MELPIEELKKMILGETFEDDHRRVIKDGDDIHVYIIDEIDDISNYSPELKAINSAKEGETVYVHVNTPGGSLYAAISIVNALKRCKAKTVALCDQACSAGTIITLSCDEVHLTDITEFMIHDVSSGNYGNTRDNKKLMEHQEKYFKQILRNTYVGFMTPQEIEDLVTHGDTLWLFGDALIERFNKWAEEKGREVIVY